MIVIGDEWIYHSSEGREHRSPDMLIIKLHRGWLPNDNTLIPKVRRQHLLDQKEKYFMLWDFSQIEKIED